MVLEYRMSLPLTLLLAGLLFSNGVQAESKAVDEASPVQLKAATDTYERGVAAMEAEKYEEALDLFKSSYSTVNSPNSQLMVGRALVKLNRLSEAYLELERASRKATELAATQKKYLKTVTSAEKELEDLKGRLAYVMVRQGASAKIQGKTFGPSEEDQAVPVLPGTVSIEVTFADGRVQNRQVSLGPGERTELPVSEPRAIPKSRSKSEDEASTGAHAAPDRQDRGIDRKTLGYVVGGVGVAGVATFVGVGLLAASVFGDPKGNCADQRCSQASLENYGSKSMLQGIGYAGLAVGVVGLGIGTWLVLGANDKPTPTTALLIGPGVAGLEHRF